MDSKMFVGEYFDVKRDNNNNYILVKVKAYVADSAGNCVLKNETILTSKYKLYLPSEDIIPIQNLETGKYGYMNINGEIICDLICDDVFDYSDGLGHVIINGKHCFLGKSGNLVINCKAYQDVGNFKYGRCPAKKDNYLGYIDKKGNLVIGNVFSYASKFLNGVAIVRENKELNIIDINGNRCFKTVNFESAFLLESGYVALKNNNKWCVIDSKGNLVLDYKYDDVLGGTDNLFVVKVNDKCSLINSNGDNVLTEDFDELTFVFGNFDFIEVKNGDTEKTIYIGDKKSKVEVNSINMVQEEKKSNSLDYDRLVLNSLLKNVSSKFVGQERAINMLAISIFNGLKKIEELSFGNTGQSNANILLEGATGTGKTAILTEIARELGVPFVARKVNTYSPVGIVGNKLNDILVDYINACGGDLNRAGCGGIILLSEFDKINSKNNELMGSLQNELLGYLEGAVITIDYKGSKVNFDTSKIIFVCDGSFTSVRNDYSSDVSLDSDDFNNANFIDDVISRLKIKVSLKKYNKEDYVNILLNSEISPLRDFVKTMNMYGINDVYYDDKFLDEVALEAVAKDEGVRGLQGIFQELEFKYVSKILQNNLDSIYLSYYNPEEFKTK